MIEIQELRIFTGIIDNGGFKNAAEQLGLTQPAVSQSLANLERKLKEKLINRSNPISATPIGLELLKHARYMLQSEQNFTQQLTKMQHGHLQNLNLAVDHLAATYYAPHIIGQFHQLLPEAEVKITRMPPREIITAIRNEQYQIGLGSFQKGMQDLHTQELQIKHSCLVTGKNNPNLALYYKNPLKFLKQTVLLASFLDDAEERPSKKKIRDYFKTTWEINDINLQLNIIKQGIGATFIADSFLQNDISNNFISLDKIPFATIKKQYGIYLLKKNLKLNSIEKFVELITKYKTQNNNNPVKQPIAML